MELSRQKSVNTVKRYTRPNREQKQQTVERFVPVITETKVEEPKQKKVSQPTEMYAKPLEPTTPVQPQIATTVQQPSDITAYLLKRIEELENKLKQQENNHMYG